MSSRVYIGTQRSGPGTGFRLARFDADSGDLSAPALVEIADDPSFFVLHPDGAWLYACNAGTPGGVSAYAVDRATGGLRLMNRHISAGRGPSQLSLDRSGRFVLDANYGGGYVEVLAIERDGRLGAMTAKVQHTGHSVDPERQTRPYAHCIVTDPSNGFALVADLGLDRVMVYRFDASTGALEPNDPPSAAVTPGSGPRHLAWHPNGRWVYLVQEISSAVTMFEWDAAQGTLRERQTLPLLPEGFRGENTSAEILVHAGGRFLVASNRGHDSIAVVAIDHATGTLRLVEHAGAHGRMPRYMAFDPTGRWLIVLNHDSDTAVVFHVDAASHKLARHGNRIAVSRPYGIAIAPDR
jgi:6-phosphogluconolactonase